MTRYLLQKSILLSALATALVGCGVDEGHDENFGNDSPVAYSDAKISVNLTESSGLAEIDLFAGATLNNAALTASDNVFVTGMRFSGGTLDESNPSTPFLKIPQDGNGVSPFIISSKNILQVNTDMFTHILRECDATDANEDGILDYPANFTYTVSYQIDAGSNSTPETRLLDIHLNSTPDAVDGIDIKSVDASGNESELNPELGIVVNFERDNMHTVSAAPNPAYLCGAMLEWAIEDTNIANVDENGVITGVSIGNTNLVVTLTSHNVSTTMPVRVVSDDFFETLPNEGVLISKGVESKELPTCTDNELTADWLKQYDLKVSGDYAANWALNGSSDISLAETSTTGSVLVNAPAAAAVGKQTVATLTHTSEASNNEAWQDDINLVVVKNKACEDVNFDEDSTPWGFDYQMENNVGGNWLAEDESTTVVQDIGRSGNGYKMTIVDADSYLGTAMAYVDWGRAATRNLHGYNLSNPELGTIGTKIAASIWVKLSSADAAVTLEHYYSPWHYLDAEGNETTLDSYQAGRGVGSLPQIDIIDGAGEPAKSPSDKQVSNAHISLKFTANLRKTTDWQLVEFVTQDTGERYGTVPNTWTQRASVLVYFQTKGLPNGESITFDDYSMVLK